MYTPVYRTFLYISTVSIHIYLFYTYLPFLYTRLHFIYTSTLPVHNDPSYTHLPFLYISSKDGFGDTFLRSLERSNFFSILRAVCLDMSCTEDNISRRFCSWDWRLYISCASFLVGQTNRRHGLTCLRLLSITAKIYYVP